MNITISEDPSMPPGYARMDVRHGSPEPVQAIRMSISRMVSDQRHLGPSGWQTTPHAFDLPVVEASDGAAVLTLGPDIVDWIQPNLKLRLAIAALGIEETVFWPSIAQSAGGDLGQGAVINGSGGSGESSTSSDPQPEPIVAHDDQHDDGMGGPLKLEADSGRKRPFILFAAALLPLILMIGYLYYPFDATDSVDPPVVEPVMASPSEPELLPAPERYAALRQANASAEEFLAFFEEEMARDNPDIDTAYRALDLAVYQRNHGPGHLAIARLYDPVSFDDRFFQRPNPAKAAEHYRKAMEQGLDDARSGLSAMCAVARQPPEALVGAFDEFDPGGVCE